MRRAAAGSTAALLLACSHATHVARPGGADRGGEAAQPAPSEGGAAERPRQARRPARPGLPPLAASPGGLFVPGGVEKVQRALAGRGYLDLPEARAGDLDEPTSAAVRRFQAEQGIARTGNPDHETVRRLGLDPDAIFRKGSSAKR